MQPNTPNKITEGENPPVITPVAEIRVMPERFMTSHETKQSGRGHWWIYLIVAVVAMVLIGIGILLMNRIVNKNNNNGPVNQTTNNASNNDNTNNGNTNQNVNSTNDNTNSTIAIKELVDTLLHKADLGESYVNYEELEATTDTATIANVALVRAQRIFTFEDTKDSVSITVKVLEAPSQTAANSTYQAENNRLKQSVGNQAGRFVKATTVGDQSLLYEKTDLRQTEAIFSWKYLIADITVDTYKGVGPVTDESKKWLARVLQNFREYDASKPITNTNDNSNLNTNLNTNVNVNTNSNQNTNGTISVNPPDRSADQDQDGLTDTEELLYKTGVDKPDTDGDSYLDGAELITGYSPIAASGARLEASGLVKVYNNQAHNFRMLYPSPWIVQNAVADGSSVVMTSETGEFVSVTIEDNPERLSARQWYLNQAPGIDATKVTDILVSGLSGVKSSDGLNVFLGSDTTIFILTYSLASQETANFVTTFEMMLRSFLLTNSTPPVGINSNVNKNTNTTVNTNINTTVNTNANANSDGSSITNGPGGSASSDNTIINTNILE